MEEASNLGPWLRNTIFIDGREAKQSNRSKESKVRKSEFTPAGFFALRTPLLPFDEWLSFDGDSDTLRKRLRELVTRPEIREALFLASPSLSESAERWLSDG